MGGIGRAEESKELKEWQEWEVPEGFGESKESEDSRNLEELEELDESEKLGGVSGMGGVREVGAVGGVGGVREGTARDDERSLLDASAAQPEVDKDGEAEAVSTDAHHRPHSRELPDRLLCSVRSKEKTEIGSFCSQQHILAEVLPETSWLNHCF